LSAVLITPTVLKKVPRPFTRCCRAVIYKILSFSGVLLFSLSSTAFTGTLFPVAYN